MLVAGGGAAIAVGQQSRGRRWLHSAGLLDGPDLEAPEIETSVVWQTLPSRHMGRDVGVGLYEPDDPEVLLVCLHGRGASHRFAFESIGVDRFVAAAGLPWAVVSADGGDSYWHPRRDGTDAQALVLEEVIPLVTSRTGSLPMLLLGWSMGGYGALLAASEHPALFAGVAASSPAVWPRFDQAADGAFDDERDFERHDLFRRARELRAAGVRIDCGRDDPFAANIAALAREIAGATVRFKDGFHEAPTWRSFVPAQLTFLQHALHRS
jgi:enterochelin esterase-like enzyme